jgi:hypothetical protein
MHEAVQIFRTLFRSAAIDGMSTSQLARPPGATADGISNRQLEARRGVAAALDALGGHHSPGRLLRVVRGRARVLGARIGNAPGRVGGSGRPVHGPVAQGILVAALGTRAAHFRLLPRSEVA